MARQDSVRGADTEEEEEKFINHNNAIYTS